MRQIVLLIFFLSIFSGCGIRQREADLEKREMALAQKEQALILREQALVQDSLRRVALDTVIAVPDTLLQKPPAASLAIEGTWQVKMVCKETSCPESAVGDTKTETWKIAGDTSNVIAQVMVGQKLVRVYSGKVGENGIAQLSEATGTSTHPQGTFINVRISVAGPNSLQGTREIIRDNECRILYDVKFDKQNS